MEFLDILLYVVAVLTLIMFVHHRRYGIQTIQIDVPHPVQTVPHDKIPHFVHGPYMSPSTRNFDEYSSFFARDKVYENVGFVKSTGTDNIMLPLFGRQYDNQRFEYMVTTENGIKVPVQIRQGKDDPYFEVYDKDPVWIPGLNSDTFEVTKYKI